MENLEKNIKEFENEFGEILSSVKFLLEKDPNLCASFLELHDIALKNGTLSKKIKFLIHTAITASQHDLESTVMHPVGAIRAGAKEDKIFETTVTIIPESGMPSFWTFLSAWNKALQK